MNTPQLIHFAHANGFPSGSYQKLFSHLESQYEIFALDKLAHNPKFPLNDNWSNQVDELIHFVEENKGDQPSVVAVGHSFGALVSYMSACKRPDLFSGLIMLDPPLITGLARYVFRFAKRNRMIDKLTPAGITMQRKQKWPIKHDLVSYFARKSLFKDFDKDCIADYVDAVMQTHGDHFQLSFDVTTEANIFRTIPHNLPSFAGELSIPAYLITGKQTDVCVPVLRNPFLKHNPTVKHIEFGHGKHMFPLEYPVELAKLLNQLIPTF